jgi:acetate kinase
MRTRSGDVDPGLLLHLQRAHGLDAAGLERVLNHDSGLRGLAGDDRDPGALVAAASAGDARARLAIDVFVHRAHRYVGAFIAVLGGIDALVFGGGIGEHVPELRERIVAPLAFAGLRIDPTRAQAQREARLSPDGAAAEVWVIPVDEGQLLAEHALAALAG